MVKNSKSKSEYFQRCANDYKKASEKLQKTVIQVWTEDAQDFETDKCDRLCGETETDLDRSSFQSFQLLM